MIKIYAIFDEDEKEIYVGITSDIKRRIQEHKRNKKNYTKKFNNFRIIYTENEKNYYSARKREKYLKSGCGK